MPRRGRKNSNSKKDKECPDSQNSDKRKDNSDVQHFKYNPGRQVDITSDKRGGLLKEIIKSGSGDFMPANGSKVFIHYTGFTDDSVIFYDTKDLGEPRSFVIGEGTCARGIEVGVTTMRKGEICIFTCKLPYYIGTNMGFGPHVHYLKKGIEPPFGPNHLVYFKVELITWKDADISPGKNGSILKRTMELGEGSIYPSEGKIVDIHMVCEYNNKDVSDRNVSFCLGAGKSKSIPKGVEIALKTFKVKEKARLIMSPDYAWGENEKPKFGIPPNTNVVYIVKLKSISKSVRIEEQTFGEILVRAVIFKEKGSEFFKNGIYPLALHSYIIMLAHLESDIGTMYESDDGIQHFIHDEVSEENNTLRQNLKLIAHLNLAACFLKLEGFNDAKTACEKALEINSKNEKGLYRRGQAYMGMGLFTKAIEDFEAVLKVNPNNAAAKDNLRLCKEKNSEKLARERSFFRSMFF